jgi:hypothetical protein
MDRVGVCGSAADASHVAILWVATALIPCRIRSLRHGT